MFALVRADSCGCRADDRGLEGRSRHRMGADDCVPGLLDECGLRLRRGRLLPGQERNEHSRQELRRLRSLVDRLLDHRLRHHVRRRQLLSRTVGLVPAAAPTTARPPATPTRACIRRSNWTGVPLLAKFFFQLVFAGTAATIVSGCVAERIHYGSFMVFTLFSSASATRSRGTGSGAAAGWPQHGLPRLRRLDRGPLGRRLGRPGRHPACWGRASANSAPTARCTPFPATAWRWRSWAA